MPNVTIRRQTSASITRLVGNGGYVLDIETDVTAVHKQLVLEVFEGFSASPKKLSSRWLYDNRGSELFDEITRQPEYYASDIELKILNFNAVKIASMASESQISTVMEFGSGNGRKTKSILSEFIKTGFEFTYMPVDVSGHAINVLKMDLEKEHGNEFVKNQLKAFIGENDEAIQWLTRQPNRKPHLLLFLGSSIGNFSRHESHLFLTRIRTAMIPGDLLIIGFDLVNDPASLLSAYSDSMGVTREFNLNLLLRLNFELGANFNIEAFRHLAIWNPRIEGMESWLISEVEQIVDIRACGRSFLFKKWEGFLTETSLKYRPENIESMAIHAGLATVTQFVVADDKQTFVSAVFRSGPFVH
jgi:dimethylhistidine N-methyltransferase